MRPETLVKKTTKIKKIVDEKRLKIWQEKIAQDIIDNTGKFVIRK